jgi:putative ABC transport system permease protein
MARVMVRPPTPLATRLLWALAWRNLWRHPWRTFITLAAICGGFLLAILFIGIGDASHQSLVRNAIALGDGHLAIQGREWRIETGNQGYIAGGEALMTAVAALDLPAVVVPRIRLPLLASSASQSRGALLAGFAATHDPHVQRLSTQLVAGSWPTEEDRYAVAIGQTMAERLGVDLGGKLVLMAGGESGESVAQLARVRAIYASGLADLDSGVIYAPLQFAASLLAATDGQAPAHPITHLAIFLNDAEAQAVVEASLRAAVSDPSLIVRNWQEMMPELVQFILIDDLGNYFFLLLILLLVILGILNALLMGVVERSREFALLRALGMGRRTLLLLVLAESLLLALLGLAAGWLLGGMLHLILATWGLNLAAVMGESTQMMGSYIDAVIYPVLSWSRVAFLSLALLLATIACGLYPAWRAMRVAPIVALTR